MDYRQLKLRPFLLATTTIIFFIIPQASSIKCFQCSTPGDGMDCSDDVLESNMTDSTSPLLKSCKTHTTLCMTTIPYIPGVPNITIRSCAPIFPHFEPRVGCRTYKEGGIPGKKCYCKEDMCINSAVHLGMLPLATLLLAPAVVTFYA